MAKKKKEQSLQYLQVPLPNLNQDAFRSIKVVWGGLNKREFYDSGEMSAESNISTSKYPYLTPSEKRIEYCDIEFPNPIGLFGFEDCLFIVNWDKNILGDFWESDEFEFSQSGGPSKLGIYGNLARHQQHKNMPEWVNRDFILITRLRKQGNSLVRTTRIMYEGTDPGVTKTKKEEQRSLVRFNVYTNPDLPLKSDLDKRILIYPDKISFNFLNKVSFEIEPFGIAPGRTVPDIKYATAHNSRVFGVTNNVVFASRYNSYDNYTTDNAAVSGAGNAWYSLSQSNTDADGDFTGITTYGDRVVCFKKDFMQEIYNNKNPFRIKDIYAEGCIDNRTIQEVDGTLFFVSEDNVKIYTGGNPEILSYNLGIKKYQNCCAGNDGRNYYLYCEDENNNGAIYVFDTYTKLWSRQSVEYQVVGFAKTTEGLFLLSKETDDAGATYYGKIYKIDTNDYNHEWSFDTEIMTAIDGTRTVDIKHLRKIQLMADFGEGSTLEVYAIYDEDETNKQMLCNISGKTGVHPIRMLVRKSANHSLKLRFEGKGYIKLYEMELITTAGGVKNVSG